MLAGLEQVGLLVRGGTFTDLLGDLSDDDLRRGRDALRMLSGLMSSFGDVVKAVGERWYGAFGFIGDALGELQKYPDIHALTVLIVAKLQQDPEITSNLAIHDDTARSWRLEGEPSFRALQLLGEQVPGLQDVLAPRRLRTAMKSKQGQRDLMEKIRAARVDWADEIDAVLATIPPEEFPVRGQYPKELTE